MEVASTDTAINDIYSTPQKIDVVNNVEVSVKVIAGPGVQFNRDGKVSVLHLRLVSASGKLLSLAELKQMSIQRNELRLLELLCQRNQQLLASLYFPGTDATDVLYRPGVSFFDLDPENGGVQITFFLAKRLPCD